MLPADSPRGRYELSRTTHTVEMSQIEEINRALRQRPTTAPVRAVDVGLDQAVLMTGRQPGGRLPGSAVLLRLQWAGDPEFPYLHAEFAPGVDEPRAWRVDVHTDALRRLAQALGLRQVWGTGSASSPRTPDS